MKASAFYAMIDANGEQARKIIASMAARAGMPLELLQLEVKIMLNGNLVLKREMHRDEMARPSGDIIDPQKRAWTRSVERHAAEHIAEVARLEARRRAYDPKDKGRYEPAWAFDIHPITAALLKLVEDANEMPVLDRSHRIDGEVGRVVAFDDIGPLQQLAIGYGSGVIRLHHAQFANDMTLNWEDSTKVPYLVIPEAYPESLLASIPGTPAAELVDLFAGAQGINLIKAVRAQHDGGGTRIDFTNRLVPWESSKHDKAPWRRTNLKQ